MWQAQAALTGFNGAKVVSGVYEAGVDVEGLGDVFNLTPSLAEFSERKVTSTSSVWSLNLACHSG